MEMPEARPGLATLGEDLLLLLIRPNGTVGSAAKVDFGLMGSELVRLAAAARVEITGDRIIVRSAAGTGDPELDGALASLAAARKPPRPRHWVGHPRKGIRDAYLRRLVAAEALSADRGGIFGGWRYRVTDSGRAARARATLDAIAQSQGEVDVTSAAIGGLAHAVGLDRLLYPGFGARPRKRLAEIAAGQWTEPAPSGASASAESASAESASAAVTAAESASAASAAVTAAASPAVTDAAMQAATDAAMQAATDAAVQAATDAAVQAATDAAVHAAVHAATAAATHAAVHAAHDTGASAAGGHH